jgi:hypothetical protein
MPTTMPDGKLMRARLMEALLITRWEVSVRALERADLDMLAAWPDCAWPYQAFRFSFASFSRDDQGMFLVERERRDDRI